MERTQNFMVRLLVFLLLMGHFALVAFFFAPSSKLLSLITENELNLLQASVIPSEVENFLSEHDIKVDADLLPDDLLGRLGSGVLELRRNKFMSETEQLALDLSLIDFGEGIIGINAASEYYFKKPLSELSATQWITLVNLHKMFLK